MTVIDITDRNVGSKHTGRTGNAANEQQPDAFRKQTTKTSSLKEVQKNEDSTIWSSPFPGSLTSLVTKYNCLYLEVRLNTSRLDLACWISHFNTLNFPDFSKRFYR